MRHSSRRLCVLIILFAFLAGLFPPLALVRARRCLAADKKQADRKRAEIEQAGDTSTWEVRMIPVYFRTRTELYDLLETRFPDLVLKKKEEPPTEASEQKKPDEASKPSAASMEVTTTITTTQGVDAQSQGKTSTKVTTTVSEGQKKKDAGSGSKAETPARTETSTTETKVTVTSETSQVLHTAPSATPSLAPPPADAKTPSEKAPPETPAPTKTSAPAKTPEPPKPAVMLPDSRSGDAEAAFYVAVVGPRARIKEVEEFIASIDHPSSMLRLSFWTILVSGEPGRVEKITRELSQELMVARMQLSSQFILLKEIVRQELQQAGDSREKFIEPEIYEQAAGIGQLKSALRRITISDTGRIELAPASGPSQKGTQDLTEAIATADSISSLVSL